MNKMKAAGGNSYYYTYGYGYEHPNGKPAAGAPPTSPREERETPVAGGRA